MTMPFFNWQPGAAPLIMNSPNPWSQSGTAPVNSPNPSQSGTAPINSPNPSQSGTAPLYQNGPERIPGSFGPISETSEVDYFHTPYAPLYQNGPERIPGSFGPISETSEVDYFRTPYASYNELPTNNADGNTRDRAGGGANRDMVSGIFSDLEPL
jgi:hypothetical protein